MKKTKEITKDLTFEQALELKPEATSVMLKYGLHCIGCHIAPFETIEQGAKAHGLSDKELKKMLEEINKK